jgi:hypothetical protein
MVKSYMLSYRVKDGNDKEIRKIILHGVDFPSMFNQNSDILMLDIEVISIILQEQ